MLDLIRKKQKSFLVKVVFWAIIATFVGTIFLVWGRGSARDQDPTVAATVNGMRIPFAEFQRTYSQLYNIYREMYRDQFSPELERQLGLEQQAVDILVEQALLMQEADRMGIEVSKKELVNAIAQIPAFQQNGTFSRDLYLKVLQYQNISPDEFEAAQRRQLLTEKVTRQIQQDVQVSEEDVEQAFREDREQVNLKVLRYSPAAYLDEVQVSEEALHTWYEENQENFRVPEKVALNYLLFDPRDYQDEVVLQESDVEKFYQRHLDRYEISEQVKASHILIEVPQDASEDLRDKKRELAETILSQIRAGEDFARLARKNSEDKASASEGGDLGYFGRGTMVAPFEQAAFSLEPGEISDVVQTPYGYHIIKVDDHINAGVKPFSEVAEDAEAGARFEAARRLAYEKAMDAYNINRRDGSLGAAAEANDLKVEQTGFFARGESIEGLGAVPEISATAFMLKSGEIARPATLQTGVVLYEVREKQESRIPKLDEVRKKAESAYRQEKAQEMARTAAEKALAKANEGQNLADIARKTNGNLDETGFFTRANGSFVPGVGSNENLANAAFNLTEEAPVADQIFTQDNAFLVAALKERKAADMSDLDQTQRLELRQQLIERKKNEALENRIQELLQQADITLAPALVDTTQGGTR